MYDYESTSITFLYKYGIFAEMKFMENSKIWKRILIHIYGVKL